MSEESDTPRTNKFYASFADGLCIPNQDEWLALCESHESELTAARAELAAVTEQRNVAAEALDRITISGCGILCRQIANEAIQSLTTNETSAAAGGERKDHE
jgi:hypothetical protein